MIDNIFQVLDQVRGETENIRIAQGKYFLPKTFKGTYKKIKTEMRWQEK